MKALAHIGTVLVATALLLGAPFAAFANKDALAAAAGQSVDVVSSATVIQEAPTGACTIYLNADKHPSEATLDDWVTFFEGAEDAPLIMEDITCVALKDDPIGVQMAESLQSRLPENQMTLRIEDSALAVSKAETGMFDALVVSDEVNAAFQIGTLESHPNVRVVHR